MEKYSSKLPVQGCTRVRNGKPFDIVNMVHEKNGFAK